MASRKDRKSKLQSLSGSELLDVLAVTVAVVKWLDATGKVLGVLDPKQASAVVRGGLYVGKCSKRRVLQIREVDKRVHSNRAMFVPDPYRDGYYLGEGEPALPAVPITAATVALWDAHFANEKSPAA